MTASCGFRPGSALSLSRYLEAVPRLVERDVPLDAAIEYSLRGARGSDRQHGQGGGDAHGGHPTLESAIRDAAVLGGERGSWPPIWRSWTPPARCPSFPRGFGPRLPTGRPRYVLRERLGKGSHGAVYLAVDRQLSQEARPALVAIKVMSEANDIGARKRLIEEAAKARRIEHPNVVRILDRGRSPGGEDYVVYEYVPGGDLEAWFRGHAGPLGRGRPRGCSRR